MHLFGEEPPKPPKEKEVAETPLMKQYNAFKKKHPEAILLFRVGDFYETFGEDAIKASKILNITLTKRANGAAAYIELAGFPHHALDNYLPKLVRAGERVAICDQLEDPKMAKGIVKRGVTELVTPGVSYNDNVLEVRKNNYLAALHFTNHDTVGIALLDISTGEFLAAQGDKEHINRLMQSFQPSEVIYNRKFRQLVEDEFDQQFNTFAIDDWVFQYDYSHEKLTKHFGTVNLKGFGIQDLTESIVAAGAAMYYLESTEHHEIRHITAISRIQEERHVWLDKFTIRNLEILSPQQEGGVPLIDILDHTVTPMGARLLRKWLILPLKNLVTIQERLDLVSAFVQNEDLTDQLLKPLKQIGDIERLISKVAAGRINPREMNHLKRALKNIIPIQQLLTSPPTPLHLERGANVPEGTFEENAIIKEDSMMKVAKDKIAKTFTTSPEKWNKLKEWAKQNRKNPTPTEDVFWEAVRNQQLGVKFRRQHAIEDFIVDFLCVEYQLVVEIDGGIHETPDVKEFDALREELLVTLGYTVLRFTNDQVLKDITQVIQTIQNFITNKKQEKVTNPFIQTRLNESNQTKFDELKKETVLPTPPLQMESGGVRNWLGGEVKKLATQLNPCLPLLEQIEKTLLEDVPLVANQGGLIAEGIHSELDELRKIAYSGKEYLEKLQQKEAMTTGITSLKISYNNVFGYYIEVRNTHKDKVPPNWIRKQTLANAERYITEELKVYEEKILTAEDKIKSIEFQLFTQLIEAAKQFILPIQQNARVLAKLDCLLSFAVVANQNHYCKPIINEGTAIDIKEGRHPVIEKQLPISEEYVPNDLFLDTDNQQIIVITGPNMAGKSALLRQTALIVLMAQMGCFVPATVAKLGLIDKVFTRVGASDNLAKGESTFMVEMTETASILNNLSERSLVLMDEIGRGTSTFDGISIAWGIVEFLHNHPKYRAKTLFATHYHELNQLAEELPRVKNFNVAVKELNNKVIFLRKLKAGGSEHSFGIHVAQMAGMPRQIVLRANEILAYLEQDKVRNHTENPLKELPRPMNVQVFEAADSNYLAAKELAKKIDINTLTPIEALMKLNELMKILK